MTGVLIRRQYEDTGREPHVTAAAETGGIQLQDKECQVILETPEAKGKVWNRFFPRDFGKEWPGSSFMFSSL